MFGVSSKRRHVRFSMESAGTVRVVRVGLPVRRSCVVPVLRPVLATARLEAGAMTGADPLRAVPALGSTPPAD